MVLAAGLGTRLRPLTDRVPKPLVEVGGRSMIEYPLRMLAAAGVEEVVVNVHHLADQVRAALGDGSRYGLRILYSPENPILDTGGAIARARPLLGEEPFVLANCDTLLDLDLGSVWRLHCERSALATLVVRADADAGRYGALELDASARVRRFLGRPSDVEGVLVQRMFCGVHVISPEVFARLPATEVFSITRDVYLPLVEAGEPVYGFDHAGYWRDLGTLQSVAKAHEDLISGAFAPGYGGTY